MNYIRSIKSHIIFIAVFAFTACSNEQTNDQTSAQANAQLVNKEDLIKAWKTMADFNVGVAENMPEEHYAYTNDPIVRNFGEQMLHIASSNFFAAANLKGEQDSANEELKSKSEIIAELKRSQEAVANALEKITLKEFEEEVEYFDGSMRSRYLFHLFWVDHMTHTRGISISFLRSNGIAPPDYIGY